VNGVQTSYQRDTRYKQQQYLESGAKGTSSMR